MMKGHALRGMFGGFLFGIFLSITLFIYGVLNFADDLMWILPLVFLVLGLVLAAWAPFGSSGEPAATAPASEPTPAPPPASEVEDAPEDGGSGGSPDADDSGA